MTRRVLLGARSGGAGFFVSRPGVDVLTAAESGMLLSTNARSMQIVQSGVVSLSSGSTTISWGALGYRPLILLVGQNRPKIKYINDNSATLSVSSVDFDINTYWNVYNKPAISSRIEWFVLRPGI